MLLWIFLLDISESPTHLTTPTEVASSNIDNVQFEFPNKKQQQERNNSAPVIPPRPFRPPRPYPPSANQRNAQKKASTMRPNSAPINHVMSVNPTVPSRPAGRAPKKAANAQQTRRSPKVTKSSSQNQSPKRSQEDKPRGRPQDQSHDQTTVQGGGNDDNGAATQATDKTAINGNTGERSPSENSTSSHSSFPSPTTSAPPPESSRACELTEEDDVCPLSSRPPPSSRSSSTGLSAEEQERKKQMRAIVKATKMSHETRVGVHREGEAPKDDHEEEKRDEVSGEH